MATISLHEACMNAVVSAIQALPLQGFTANQVVKHKAPELSNASFPCAFVTIKGCREELHQWSTEEDEKVLPVAVHLLDREDVHDASGLSAWLRWLEQMQAAFLSQVLAGVGSNWRIDLESMDVLDAAESAGPAWQHAVSSFFVRCSFIVPSATSFAVLGH